MSPSAHRRSAVAAPLRRVSIGSRGSRLAREQARRVGRRLEEAWPDLRVEYRIVTTRGDRVLDRPLPALGGKGLFTAELEASLRERRVALAVHSLKDLPTEPTDELGLLAVPLREDPRDVLVGARPVALDEVREGGVVGTSSLRRAALLLRRRPDCRVSPIRGNVETRLRKLEEGEYDALVLAAAGLERLGLLADRCRDGRACYLEPPGWLPAPGQGALGVQGRTDDPRLARLAAAAEDEASRAAVFAERAFLAALGGGCRVPIGALAAVEGKGELLLRGIVLGPEGREAVEGEVRGAAGEPEELGRRLADEIAARGGEALLADYGGPRSSGGPASASGTGRLRPPSPR